MNTVTNREKIRRLTMIAMLAAIVVVLQLLGSFIHFGPFSVSLVLIPIVVGAVMYGSLAGSFLGLVFGVTVLISGDAALFLGYSGIGTVITVLAKGILAGLASALVYRLLKKLKLNNYIAVIISAVVCPIVNSGIFLLGCMTFFFRDLSDIGTVLGVESIGNPFVFVVTVLIGFNFIFELAVNIILGPTIVVITDYAKKLLKK